MQENSAPHPGKVGMMKRFSSNFSNNFNMRAFGRKKQANEIDQSFETLDTYKERNYDNETIDSRTEDFKGQALRQKAQLQQANQAMQEKDLQIQTLLRDQRHRDYEEVLREINKDRKGRWMYVIGTLVAAVLGGAVIALVLKIAAEDDE